MERAPSKTYVLLPVDAGVLPEVSPSELHSVLGKVKVVDVRTPGEFLGELGHIQGAELVTMGPDIEKWLNQASKDEEIVFVCRSGARSAQCTLFARQAGYKAAMNLRGGMIEWRAQGLPIAE